MTNGVHTNVTNCFEYSRNEAKKEQKVTPGPVANYWTAGVHCHGNTFPVVEMDKRQPVRDGHDLSMFQVHKYSANFTNQRDGYRVDLLGLLDRSIRDTYIYNDRKWHLISE